MNKNTITINVESLNNEDDTIRANFKGNVKNYSQLISLGGAVLQTLLNSSAEIIKKNNTELDIPDNILQLTILDSLVDKVCNLIQVSTDYTDKEKSVDDFLNTIIKGMKNTKEDDK